ncbi:DUF202 domain-containing protein [Sodalis glossinidius]|uniref:DUF202 domain-containing protein n=1 Tax=Sodalis glossinidius TaxID=63612 RepID=UPI000A0440BD
MRDPGLQPERTSLTWAKTNFLLFVVALLLVPVCCGCPDIVFHGQQQFHHQ